MVARINTGKSISKALNYNEQKVREGKAEILDESGFLKDVDKLSFYDKINHFKRFTSLNEGVVTNTLHVSLNFDPSEKIDNDKMVEIASAYMDKIGFGKQPYLLYRHHDAGHPHLHIVSINIEKDGTRISMHNLGRNQSEKARKEIEREFRLVKAENKKNTDLLNLKPVNATKVIYGKSETRRAIANVLAPVINQYKFTSLAELNAVLQLYNITADRGREGSRIYRNNGLTYSILDEKGNKMGVPQKASSFFMRPTLGNLEKKYAENELVRIPYKEKLKGSVGWILNTQPESLEAFVKALEKERISLVIRKGKEGVIYGMTYVDHKTKCVFNGSDLGRQFSAKAVLETCQSTGLVKPKHMDNKLTLQEQLKNRYRELMQITGHTTAPGWRLPEIILSQTVGPDYVPNQLIRKKKRKNHRLKR
mgnify:FL=1